LENCCCEDGKELVECVAKLYESAAAAEGIYGGQPAFRQGAFQLRHVPELYELEAKRAKLTDFMPSTLLHILGDTVLGDIRRDTKNEQLRGVVEELIEAIGDMHQVAKHAEGGKPAEDKRALQIENDAEIAQALQKETVEEAEAARALQIASDAEVAQKCDLEDSGTPDVPPQQLKALIRGSTKKYENVLVPPDGLCLCYCIDVIKRPKYWALERKLKGDGFAAGDATRTEDGQLREEKAAATTIKEKAMGSMRDAMLATEDKDYQKKLCRRMSDLTVGNLFPTVVPVWPRVMGALEQGCGVVVSFAPLDSARRRPPPILAALEHTVTEA
jgi:hypothetical protein